MKIKLLLVGLLVSPLACAVPAPGLEVTLNLVDEKGVGAAIGQVRVSDSKYGLVLAPDLPWEGGDLPTTLSVGGDAPEHVRQIRDPYLFEDADGRHYLFYAGRGEDAIGVAELFFE